MALPSDPIILMSYLNTQLRDKYSSFDELCDDMQLDSSARSEMEGKLKAVGYAYSEASNSFVRSN